MKKNRLVVSDAAVSDILEQAEWYSAQSGNALAGRWERAVASAILRVVSRPTTGAPCTFQSSELRDVRRTAIRGFPKHLLFYRVDSGEVFVLRVVHGARDLERLL
ncbi:MAG: type II toxin-antitoxin system RelE/ParE family toxin [Terriglobales bacterium]